MTPSRPACTSLGAMTAKSSALTGEAATVPAGGADPAAPRRAARVRLRRPDGAAAGSRPVGIRRNGAPLTPSLPRLGAGLLVLGVRLPCRAQHGAEHDHRPDEEEPGEQAEDDADRAVGLAVGD